MAQLLLTSLLFLLAFYSGDGLSIFCITRNGDVLMRNCLDKTMFDTPETSKELVSGLNINITEDAEVMLKSVAGSHGNNFSIYTSGIVQKIGSWNQVMEEQLKIKHKGSTTLQVNITCDGDVKINNAIQPSTNVAAERITVTARDSKGMNLTNTPSLQIFIRNSTSTQNELASKDWFQSLNARIQFHHNKDTKQAVIINISGRDNTRLLLNITSDGYIKVKNERRSYVETIFTNSNGIIQKIHGITGAVLDGNKIVRDENIELNVDIVTYAGTRENNANRNNTLSLRKEAISGRKSVYMNVTNAVRNLAGTVNLYCKYFPYVHRLILTR